MIQIKNINEVCKWEFMFGYEYAEAIIENWDETTYESSHDIEVLGE